MKGLDSEAMGFINRFISDIKRLCYGRMNLTQGARVLDVGCGTGSDAMHLSTEVGSTGLAVGLDIDEASLPRDVSGPMAGTPHFVVGDAHDLPMGDASFDVVWADRLLQHVGDPVRALCEMRRVARPSARIVLADADHASATVRSLDAARTARLMAYRANQITNGSAGRLLAEWCGAANIHVQSTQTHKIIVDNLATAKMVGLFFKDWHLKYGRREPACRRDVDEFLADLAEMDSQNQFRFESEFHLLTGTIP